MWAQSSSLGVDAPGTADAILPVGSEALAPNGQPAAKVRLIPFGSFRDDLGEGPWTLAGDAQAREVVAATRGFQEPGESLNIDVEHKSLLQRGGGGFLAGSIRPLLVTVERDGIYCEIDWTMMGYELVMKKAWRYVVAHVRAERETGKITRITGAGMTNLLTGARPAGPADVATNSTLAAMRLTDEERAICALVGVDELDFVLTRFGDQAPASTGLDQEELAICAALGVSPQAFAMTKARQENVF